jgi:gluconokinase
MIIVVFGVSGCGKTTIGTQLAKRLDWDFIDADDYHPERNISKMRQGIALSDEDRIPWLNCLKLLLNDHIEQNKQAVIACSALKHSYRRSLGVNQQNILSVLLDGNFELIQSRLKGRTHTFMNNNLLHSQFEALERPTDGITVNINAEPREICQTIIKNLNLIIPRPE